MSETRVSRIHEGIDTSVETVPDTPQVISEPESHDILQRLIRLSHGGGFTAVRIDSHWTGNVRWGRNLISTSGETRQDSFSVVRGIDGAVHREFVGFSDPSDASCAVALRTAERFARAAPQNVLADLIGEAPVPVWPTVDLLSPATVQLNTDQRSAAARMLAQSSIDAGMLSAGYLEVSLHSWAWLNSLGQSQYYSWTFAQYSVTVRDPQSTGSGWAGMDHNDWSKIDGLALSKTALDKCLAARHPARVEPGRYTVILEPQAVCALMEPLIFQLYAPDMGFSWQQRDVGRKVIDERVTLSTDPTDPELGYPPMYANWAFGLTPERRHAPRFTWIEHGVLRRLKGGFISFRMHVDGPSMTVADMIASTQRGVLVTRFDRLSLLNTPTQLHRGYTRDGLWLIENGKITKAINNLVFTDSPMFALNKLEGAGTPVRVYRPPPLGEITGEVGPYGVIVPPLKVSDFSFTALTDAV